MIRAFLAGLVLGAVLAWWWLSREPAAILACGCSPDTHSATIEAIYDHHPNITRMPMPTGAWYSFEAPPSDPYVLDQVAELLRRERW